MCVKNLFTIAIGSVMLFSCSDNSIGLDSSLEGISDIVVTSLPGGAKVEYRILDDESISYIQAVYTLESGRNDTVIASASQNFLIVEGLRPREESHQITLTMVDGTGNESEPTLLFVNPESAPIDLLFETIVLSPAYEHGGIKIAYNNVNNISAEFQLYAFNEEGIPEYNQSLFIDRSLFDSISTVTDQFQIFESLPSGNARFGVRIIDEWENEKGMVEDSFKLYGKIHSLDKTHFRDILLANDVESGHGWVKSNLWDGNIDGDGFHTVTDDLGYVIAPYLVNYHAFTIDLGSVEKLRKLEFWQRQEPWLYWHGNPRYYEIWGIDEIPFDNGASLEGWIKLVENGEVQKDPEKEALCIKLGMQECPYGIVRDLTDFPLDAPPVRYIRFVNKENWAGTKFIHLMEVDFWATIEE